MKICWSYDRNSLSTVYPTLFLSSRQRNVSFTYIIHQIPSSVGQVEIQCPSSTWKNNVSIFKILNHVVAITFSFYLLQMKEAIHKRYSSQNASIYWKNLNQCWLWYYTLLSWHRICKVHTFSTSQAVVCLYFAAWASAC